MELIVQVRCSRCNQLVDVVKERWFLTSSRNPDGVIEIVIEPCPSCEKKLREELEAKSHE